MLTATATNNHGIAIKGYIMGSGINRSSQILDLVARKLNPSKRINENWGSGLLSNGVSGTVGTTIQRTRSDPRT
jgi:hypothetical protein